MTRHLACATGGLWGLLLGLAAVAHAQAGGEPPGAAGGFLEALLPPPAVALIHELGLPGALLVLGWWARGVTISGVPVTVSLAEADRTEISRFRTALERRLGAVDPSEDPKPAAGAKA